MIAKLMCIKCGEDIVHPEREYAICLDCLIKEMKEQLGLEVPITWTRKFSSIGYYDKEGNKIGEDDKTFRMEGEQ